MTKIHQIIALITVINNWHETFNHHHYISEHLFNIQISPKYR